MPRDIAKLSEVVFHKSISVVIPPLGERANVVGRGPSHATRACERVSLAIVRALQRARGTGPRATGNRDSTSI